MDIRPLARTKDLIVQETENEVLVYDLEKNTAICLNETAVCVWNSCDGKKSINELAQTLTDKKGKQVSTDIIWLALNQLKKEKLLVLINQFGL